MPDPTIDPSTALAPPPGWTPPSAPAMGGAPQLPTPIQPPVTQATPTPQQASTDPEMQAGAAHQSWLGHIMDTVGSILGGDQTIHITKGADGTMTVTHDPSTSGEKWARVAKAALMGGAAGLANGQGPGGPARAIAAGVGTGAGMQEQQLQQANAQVNQMNKQQIDAANQALLHQKVIQTTWENNIKPIEWAQTQAERAANFAEHMNNMGAIPVAENLRNAGDVATYGKVNRDVVDGHLSKPGAPQVAVYPNSSGTGVAAWKLPTDASKQMYDQPWTFDIDELDKAHPGKVVTTSHTIDPNIMTKGDHVTREMALFGHNDDVRKAAATISATAQKAENKDDTNPLAMQLAAQREPDPVKRQQMMDALTADQQRRVQIARESRPPAAGGLLAGGGGAAAGGTTGEDYLKAAVDPSMWNQVKSIAAGDVKMPTAGMRGANQALRNAVMNYDPTFTDARYTTKQNFKDKGDATSLSQLSTAMEHLERASQNSQAAGYAPLLSSGITPSSAAYNQDLKLFTEEAGKLVANKAITQGEYEDLKKGMDSSMPYVRDAAIKETTNLLGGKVGAIFQKYKAGAGHDLPVQEFFDAPTQARLSRYGVTPAAGGVPGPTSIPTPTPTPTPAATGAVTVQIPGLPAGQIPRSALQQFQRDHPNAKVF